MSSSPQKLTRTNFKRLQRELEVQQAKLIELSEQGILRAKDKNLRKVIHTVSSFVFVVLLGAIMFCNYVMLAPHLNAVATACLLALVLSSLRERLTRYVRAGRSRLVHRLFGLRDSPASPARLGLVAAAFAAAACAVAVLAAAPSEPRFPEQTTEFAARVVVWRVAAGAAWLTVAGAAAAVALLVVDPRALTAGSLTVVVLLAICVPLLYALKQCAREAEVVAKFFMGIIESDETLRSTVDTILASGWFRAAHRQATNLLGPEVVPSEVNGVAVKDTLRNSLRQVAEVAGSNMQAFSGNVLSVVSNLSNIVWAFTTFSTTLFYLLNNESPWEYFDALSPLSPQDNAELYESIKTSTSSILKCSVCILTCHFSVMYGLLSFCDFQIVAIPSFACGLFAVMPLWGTYVVFVPVACVMWASGQPVSAVAVVAIELVMVLYTDPKLTSFIPGDSHFVALSIAAGLYSFGALGVLYGPLLVCLLGSVFQIYIRYLKKPLNNDMYSPNPRRKLFGGRVAGAALQ